MTDRYCEIAVSKDGGHTFGAWTAHHFGEDGDFQTRVVRRRMGQGRDFVVKIRVSSPHRRDLLAASIQMESVDG